VIIPNYSIARIVRDASIFSRLRCAASIFQPWAIMAHRGFSTNAPDQAACNSGKPLPGRRWIPEVTLSRRSWSRIIVWAKVNVPLRSGKLLEPLKPRYQ